jgi:hypothetical protein
LEGKKENLMSPAAAIFEKYSKEGFARGEHWQKGEINLKGLGPQMNIL